MTNILTVTALTVSSWCTISMLYCRPVTMLTVTTPYCHHAVMSLCGTVSMLHGAMLCCHHPVPHCPTPPPFILPCPAWPASLSSYFQLHLDVSNCMTVSTLDSTFKVFLLTSSLPSIFLICPTTPAVIFESFGVGMVKPGCWVKRSRCPTACEPRGWWPPPSV